MIFFSLFLNDLLRLILFFQIEHHEYWFILFRISHFFPVDFFRFHCRPSLWGFCNENKSMEQTLPPIDVVGIVADVLRSFLSWHKSHWARVENGQIDLLGFQRNRTWPSLRGISVKNWRNWLKKQLLTRIPVTGEKPWTSSSIFRLMWVTDQNIQDIISSPTSITPHWMWSLCWNQKQRQSFATWFMKPTAKSSIFLSVKTQNMTYWLWGNMQGENSSSLDKNKI